MLHIDANWGGTNNIENNVWFSNRSDDVTIYDQRLKNILWLKMIKIFADISVPYTHPCMTMPSMTSRDMTSNLHTINQKLNHSFMPNDDAMKSQFYDDVSWGRLLELTKQLCLISLIDNFCIKKTLLRPGWKQKES